MKSVLISKKHFQELCIILLSTSSTEHSEGLAREDDEAFAEDLGVRKESQTCDGGGGEGLNVNNILPE